MHVLTEYQGIYRKECLDNLREALEKKLWYGTETGTPCTERGLKSQAYSRYFRQLKELVEAASNMHHRKVILFGHSYGGMLALEFVRNMTVEWRKEYIKHLTLCRAHALHRVRGAGVQPRLRVREDNLRPGRHISIHDCAMEVLRYCHHGLTVPEGVDMSP
jgi:hypothetical protein